MPPHKEDWRGRENLLPDKLKKRVLTYNKHHYIRVKYVNDYLHFLKELQAQKIIEVEKEAYAKGFKDGMKEEEGLSS